MRIQFLGAAGQVTGSRYFLESGGQRLLIDCGLFQERATQSRNWDPPPIPPETVDALLLTHAHLDHAGLIPRFVADGYTGPIFATEPTRDLARIILLDSARIQAEDAKFKNKRHQREGRRPPHPVKPLYTADHVEQAMSRFRIVDYGKAHPLNNAVDVTYRDAGHILGSASLELRVRENGTERTIVFSGDVGQRGKPIVRDPVRPASADYIIMESTYGGRRHDNERTVESQLCDVINSTVDAGGNIIIPTFAVERAQELLYILTRLVHDDRIPQLMTFLDSPMAVSALDVFRHHPEFMDADAQDLLKSGQPLMRYPGLSLIESRDESKSINRIRGSCIIMAGSGMCNAGRIKHHLARNISRPECTVLLTGYQAAGTLGRELVERRPIVRIHGAPHHVRARVVSLLGFSAHADHDGLIDWLGALKQPPRRIFLTHGEPSAANALAADLRSRAPTPIEIPAFADVHELG